MFNMSLDLGGRIPSTRFVGAGAAVMRRTSSGWFGLISISTGLRTHRVPDMVWNVLRPVCPVSQSIQVYGELQTDVLCYYPYRWILDHPFPLRFYLLLTPRGVVVCLCTRRVCVSLSILANFFQK